ncbi:hypothetical protein PEC301899_37240 [Pectobacterium carotovorum subsp. carotovorum]|nr:hypothetical protein PEC301899_37240 [Pectobacterium carotovorum subsp. carotovorum]
MKELLSFAIGLTVGVLLMKSQNAIDNLKKELEQAQSRH